MGIFSDRGLPVYVMHHRPLVERKRYLDAYFKSIGESPIWIDEEYSTIPREKFVLKDPYGPEELSPGKVSIFEKHMRAYEHMVYMSHPPAEHCLIFEDDMIFPEDFEQRFTKRFDATPDDYDLIFFSNGAHLVPDPNSKLADELYLKAHPASRCVDAYIVRPEAAAKILDYTLKDPRIELPTDHYINKAMKHHNMRVYWWHPPLIDQGSATGVYKPAY
jgi:GR25 family glycosyltransferase involved in LPS biosynthesis